jgi:hypothetical protein
MLIENFSLSRNHVKSSILQIEPDFLEKEVDKVILFSLVLKYVKG